MSYWKAAWKTYKVNMFILGVIASLLAGWFAADKAMEELSR